VSRARRHHRLLSVSAFALLVVAAELAGRYATFSFDRLLHVQDPIAPSARYTPFVLAAVKVGCALLAARLAWRFARAHTTARAGHRLLSAVGGGRPRAPRVCLRLSPRLWLAAFGSTSAIYLVQADFERHAATLSPWLHTYALPVFGVLAVLVAVGWGAVARWLADYESYAAETIRRARVLAAATGASRPGLASRGSRGPRSIFGLAFESRPPPAPA
jgi:hypothetical protein